MVKPCIECGREKRIVAKGLCGACYRKSRIAKCAYCHRVKPFITRTEDGKAVCQNCHTAECAYCHEVKPIHARTKDDEAVCQNCHTAECVYCHEVKPIIARTKDGGAVCKKCHTEECVYCHQKKPIQARTEDGGAMCWSCWMRATGRYSICPSCQKGPRVISHISPVSGDKVCGTCYRSHKKEVESQPA